jgi:hypothetical protein
MMVSGSVQADDENTWARCFSENLRVFLKFFQQRLVNRNNLHSITNPKKRKPAKRQASLHVNDILRRSTPSFAEAKHTRS